MSSPLYENLPDNINKNKRNLPKNFNDLVYCIGWHEHEKWAEVEISSDFKVYPCCTLHAEHQLEKTFFDDKLFFKTYFFGPRLAKFMAFFRLFFSSLLRSHCFPSLRASWCRF